MKPGDTVKHHLTGITGDITRVFNLHKFVMITVYSNGHYVTGLKDDFRLVTADKSRG